MNIAEELPEPKEEPVAKSAGTEKEQQGQPQLPSQNKQTVVQQK